MCLGVVALLAGRDIVELCHPFCTIPALDVFVIAGVGDSSQNADYRHHDHDFEQGEAIHLGFTGDHHSSSGMICQLCRPDTLAPKSTVIDDPSVLNRVSPHRLIPQAGVSKPEITVPLKLSPSLTVVLLLKSKTLKLVLPPV